MYTRSAVLESLSRKPFAVIGHRGARGLAPENSLLALRKAIEAGADIAEFDLQATRDNVVVASHDPMVDADGGRRVRIRESFYHELKGVTIGGEPIPRLEDILSEARDRIALFLEVKEPRDTRLIVSVLRREHALDYTALISFYDEALVEAKRLEPKLPTGLIYYKPPGRALDAKKLRCEIALPRYNVASERAIGLAHRLGLKVVVWTINDRQGFLEYYRRGVDGIATDYPDRAIEARKGIESGKLA